MERRLEQARTELKRAADETDGEDVAASHVREQLESIAEGIGELRGEGTTKETAAPHTERVEELEEKLLGLEEEPDVDGELAARVDDAREHLRAYRHDERSGE